MDHSEDNQDYEADPVKDENNSEWEAMEPDEPSSEAKNSYRDSAGSFVKCETTSDNASGKVIAGERQMTKEEIDFKCFTDYLKIEKRDVSKTQSEQHLINMTALTTESRDKLAQKTDINDILNVPTKAEPFNIIKKEISTDIIERGGVEIVNETKMEMDNCEVRQKISEIRFGVDKTPATSVKVDSNNCQQFKLESNASIDEFDVEAQMKMITGDDGDDYKEKIDTSSEKDKSMDGIEGLMDSSKEDSDSEDQNLEDLNDVSMESDSKVLEERMFEEFEKKEEVQVEKRPFKEFETKPAEASPKRSSTPEVQQCFASETITDEVKNRIFAELEEKFDNKIEESVPSVSEAKSDCLAKEITEPKQNDLDKRDNTESLSKESQLLSIELEMEVEQAREPEPIVAPILPLSERIKRKTDTPAKKKKLPIEAAIIESSIALGECGEISMNGDDRTIVSNAFKELLEGELDTTTPCEPAKEETLDNSEAFKELLECNLEANPCEVVAEQTVELEEEIAVKHDQLEDKVEIVEQQPVKVTEIEAKIEPTVAVEEAPKKPPVVKESVKDPRLCKDPRKATPKELSAPNAMKPAPAPIKRKVSTLNLFVLL